MSNKTNKFQKPILSCVFVKSHRLIYKPSKRPIRSSSFPREDKKNINFTSVSRERISFERKKKPPKLSFKKRVKGA